MSELQRKVYVTRKDNVITIEAMNHPRCVTDFAWEMIHAQKAGYSDIQIVWTGTDVAIYPNACVPIASMIDFFTNECGFTFEYTGFDEYKGFLNSCHFRHPMVLSEEEIHALPNPFNALIRYENFHQVYAFTQKCIDYITKQETCEKGALDGLQWCINEVMDNVNVHSERGYGFVMAQFHRLQKRIVFCIADSGIGIFNSLRASNHRPSTNIDAISLAIQEGIGDGKGQGNGLFGLFQIIKSNGGCLTITSHGASMMLLQDGTINKYTHLPCVNFQTPGTIVDFQMYLDKEVCLSDAFSSIGGYDEIDYSIEKLMDDNNVIQFDVFANCEGTATREAGRMLRNTVINMVRRASAPICLDFSKVNMVSSSFIDEFLSKMVIDMGLVQFNQVVRIKQMNPTVSLLFNRSTYMRIHNEWENRGTDRTVIDNE